MKKSRKIRRTSRAPTDVDRVVGENVRQLRRERNLTLAELAYSLGISHQQLQKYETGTNRLSAGMISCVAEVLCVPIESLFRKGSETQRRGTSPEEADRDELRQQCRFWIDQAGSVEVLKEMVRVLKALS